MTTSPDRWATVERLYHAALAQPVGDRAAFLAKACAGDEELRREVESLLAQDDSGDAGLTRGGRGRRRRVGQRCRPIRADFAGR
jgi:hypothetical protein